MVTGNLTRGSLIQSHAKHNDSAATQRLLCLRHTRSCNQVQPSTQTMFKRWSEPVKAKVKCQP